MLKTLWLIGNIPTNTPTFFKLFMVCLCSQNKWETMLVNKTEGKEKGRAYLLSVAGPAHQGLPGHLPPPASRQRRR